MTTSTHALHPTVRRFFAGRKIVVATMHGKHHVMKPLIKQYLNIDSIIVPQIDTDEFGTFTGEIARPFDAMTTLRKKILKGLDSTGETMGVGSEGSFGPHPQLPFVQANEEIVMLIDRQYDLEITEHIITSETNHARQEIGRMKDLLKFTERIQFPSHGIILKQVRDGRVQNIRKGILSWEMLYAVYLQFKGEGMTVIAETDMRGYMNPTRMKTIETVTELLMKKVTNLCPECQWPGFGVVNVKPGLACRQCGTPTKLTLSKVYHCANCSYTDERFYVEGHGADPMHCDHCNP